MKVCIVSDSHDRAEPLDDAVRAAKAAGAEAVIHCGDLIGTQTLKPALAHGVPQELLDEIESLRREVGELAERVDFTERLLTDPSRKPTTPGGMV